MLRIQIVDLRCEYLENPLGIDDVRPRLGWRLESERTGAAQSAYRVQVASTKSNLLSSKADLWDSGIVSSDQCNFVSYEGVALESRQSCFWRVKVWDERSKQSAWSEIGVWEMGILAESDWSADWITLDLSDENKDAEYELPPAPFFREEFEIRKPIKSARLYITSLGLYEAYINGQRVGDLTFTPGWTDYSKRLYYNTYDVARLLHHGGNAMGSILSYGWYSGYIGYAVLVGHRKHKDFYGKGTALRCQLEIIFEDGTTQTVISDDSWKAQSGPIRSSDILMGESYDSRKEQKGWVTFGYDESTWKEVKLVEGFRGTLQAYPGVPVRITEEIQAVSVTKGSRGKWVFDFGQNFAGVVRLSIKGKRGQKVRIRHGEMLHDDGSLMTENLRKARAEDVYICSGAKDAETWQPSFTYHGFRYAEVSGLKSKPSLSLLTGVVIGTDTEATGFLDTNNPLLNQLYQNIVWTQRANYLEVPTDCPQRDERLGWLGDAQVYVNSACYNMNVAPFFKKWMRDVTDAQWLDGAYANFAPRPFNRPRYRYSPAWMEAGVICPFTIWQNYGDKGILEEHFESMLGLANFHLAKVGPVMVYDKTAYREVTPSGGWGDWLGLGKKTPKFQIANCYLGHCLKLVAEIATILGKKKEAKFYLAKLKRFQCSFSMKYLVGSQIEGETQTLCAMIILLRILPGKVERIARRRLLELVEESDGRMNTGFIGSRFLLPALSEIGRSDIAYKFLLNENSPGWLYSVVNGATSIWERWNSYNHETGFYDPEMNSFSHYAFGAVCEWMFGYMAGIRPLEAGYRRVLLAPEIPLVSQIDCVSAKHKTLYGEIVSAWDVKDGICRWQISLPANTTGLVRLPQESMQNVEVLDIGTDKKFDGEAVFVNEMKGEFNLPSGNFLLQFPVAI